MKMDWIRTPLLGGILIICFLLVVRWNSFQDRVAETQVSTQVAETQQIPANSQRPITIDPQDIEASAQKETAASSFDLPEAIEEQPKENFTPSTPNTALIRIKTDVLDVYIDPYGGDIVKASLLKHYEKINTPDQPFILLENTASHTYIARSGLVGKNGTDSSRGRPRFDSVKSHYSLTDGKDSLAVDLTYNTQDVDITKRFVFKRDNYLIDVNYIINNNSTTPWQANLVGSIKRGDYNPVKSTALGMQPFLGAATTTDETNYDKYDFGDLRDSPLKHSKEGGWVAMVQHYFISAWVPPQDVKNTFELKPEKNTNNFILSFISEPTVVEARQQKTINAGFYVGPKNIKKLEKISQYLDLTVDYSFLWWIAKPLFFGLDFIHNIVGNWGITIILLTICIKIVFFYPSATSFRSMAKMRKLQPKMQSLKEQYGSDKQKFSQEMMKLYRTEKVNPVSGCLPILIQMPVFMALYWVLMESVELRHAPFYLWIHDLSVKDPYYIMPLIMGATMWIQQQLNPKPTDPMQAKVMQMMPLFFTFLFMVFPAGLVLYWVVNNTLSIIQQYIITKKIENE